MKPFPLLVLLVALAQPAVATDPLPLADGANNPGTPIDLLAESIIAAGDCRLRSQIHKNFERAGEQLQRHISQQDTSKELARKILTLMHREILTGEYDAELFSVGQTLAKGDYNCLTATILYCCLCKTVNLDVAIMSVPGHVSVRLGGPSNQIIETTCSAWPAPKRPAVAIAREISETQLVARVYYNRGVYHASRHQYQHAIAALDASIFLDPHDHASIRNRSVALNNWSLELCSQGRYGDASKLVGLAYSVSPCSEVLATAEYVHLQWLKDQFAQGQFEQAIAILDDAIRLFPSSTIFKKFRENLGTDLTIPRL